MIMFEGRQSNAYHAELIAPAMDLNTQLLQ